MYAATAVVALVGVVVGSGLGQSLFPAFQERDFLMHWVGVPSTSDAETVRTTTAVSKELRAIPGVRSFGAHIGQALLGEEVFGVNFGENWISLDPDADYTKAREEIDAVAAKYPGLFAEVQTYLDERIEEVLTGGKEPIIIRVYGEDLGVLREKSAEVLDVLASIPGVKDAHTDISADIPQVEVRGRTGQGREVRPEARRRPPSRGDHGGRGGGRRHLPRRPCLRRRRVEHPGDQVRRHRPAAAAHRHALRGAGEAQGRRDSGAQAQPERH